MRNADPAVYRTSALDAVPYKARSTGPTASGFSPSVFAFTLGQVYGKCT